MPTKKKWYLSRTLWANTIGAIATNVANAANAGGVDPGTVAMIFAGVNMALRLLTNKELER